VGVPVTDELYDLVLFVVHSFVRPIATELYALGSMLLSLIAMAAMHGSQAITRGFSSQEFAALTQQSTAK